MGKIEISMESGGHTSHDYDVCACALKHACMLLCMHTIFLHALDHISAQFGQIREVEISMEIGGHARHEYHVSVHTCSHYGKRRP